MVILGTSPLAAYSKPSERTPVLTATSSTTTSATIELMMTNPTTARVPETKRSDVRMIGINGEPFGSIKPSSRSGDRDDAAQGRKHEDRDHRVLLVEPARQDRRGDDADDGQPGAAITVIMATTWGVRPQK